MEKISFALPKGRLFGQTIDILRNAGILKETVSQDTRKLIIESENFRFFVVRSKDVPVYVESGIADFGVAGDDVLDEGNYDVYRPVDLGIGYCRIVVAGKPESRELYENLSNSVKVATKYPKIAGNFFSKKGIKPIVYELYGSVELAPLVGLAPFIVDIVETGTTLKENGLVVIDTIKESTAKLIVNRVSYKTKSQDIFLLINTVESFLGGL
ncbi:MAG: ATP phosphoribosyltransferase [Hydrogenothermaceae bacterium]|nr:ATP phosphoribosyltransferase [Hydrogenothermaceae bacterium]